MKSDVKNTFGIYDPDKSSPGRHFYAVQFDTVENLIRMTNSGMKLRLLADRIVRGDEAGGIVQRLKLIERAENAIKRAIEFRTTGDFKL